jgi:hypothetical protein
MDVVQRMGSLFERSVVNSDVRHKLHARDIFSCFVWCCKGDDKGSYCQAEQMDFVSGIAEIEAITCIFFVERKTT